MDYPQQHIKPYNEEGKKTEQVERMFDNIAHAYDKLNHTLSLGIDRSWRRKAIAWLRPFHPQRMMDVATGTGGFRYPCLPQTATCRTDRHGHLGRHDERGS